MPFVLLLQFLALLFICEKDAAWEITLMLIKGQAIMQHYRNRPVDR
jgi:hypothetical protein